MDNYPPALAPHGNDTFEKELFAPWWARVRYRFPTVPANVARQWLWRHWGHSHFSWLPSGSAAFTLTMWGPHDIATVQVWREGNPPYADWGDTLLERGRTLPKPARAWLLAVMARRRRWPVPPIVLDNRQPIEAPWDDLPHAFVLIEGHRRMAMAKSLARSNQISASMPVWILSYS